MAIADLEKCSPHSSGWYNVKDQFTSFIYKRSEEAFAKGDKARDAIKNKKELEARQKWVRKVFIQAIGGLPSFATPLNSKIVGKINCKGFAIEKIIFESRPKTYVTANLYLPDKITSPRPAVLFLCGHHELAKHAQEYQIVCQYLVQAGLIVLIQDPIGQGERFSYYEKYSGKTFVNWGCPEHDYAGNQCLILGDGIARYFVHDAMRGIDYLSSRKEVDSKKIGVTGNSGGGTQTSLMMLCDPRIAAAAPATFIMNRQTYMYSGQAQDAEQIWQGMTALGVDHEDILLMMVPKPVRVLAVKYDFFPIEGTRRTVSRVERFWKFYGKKNSIDLIEDTSTHSYTVNLAKAAAEFFSYHLLGKKNDLKGHFRNEFGTSSELVLVSPLEPSKLWCTTSGQVLNETKSSHIVYDENKKRLEEIVRIRSSIPILKHKKRAFNWLKEKIFANRKPCDFNPRIYLQDSIDDLNVQAYIWWSQEGIFNNAFIFRHSKFSDKSIPVTIAIWDNGTNSLASHLETIKKLVSKGRAVIVLDTSGVGALEPHPFSNAQIYDRYGTMHKLNDDLIWLDDSLAAIRIYDVLRALDALKYLPKLKNEDIQIYACGRQGVYGQIAAFLDKRIKKINIANSIESYANIMKSKYYNSYDIKSIILPAMLKYFDVQDLKKWIKIERRK